MLWSKESNKKNALYADIFALKNKVQLNKFHFAVQTEYKERGHSTCAKSDEKALEKRKKGNQLFAERKWSEAAELYNESLCYAKQELNISLSYANRSACFIRMKMYRECLIDINLAKKFGFPADKMPKLDERMADCLQNIDGVHETDSRIEMSFDTNDKFLCMTNVLKFERNSNGNHSIIAKEDIDVGQTIAVEKAFSTCLYMCYGWKCNICLKRNANLIPCTKCTVAMFCYGTCETNAIHEYECGLTFMGKSQIDGIMMNLARDIFKLINIFPTADELMKFVELVINSDKNDLPDALIDDKEKYGAFLKLPHLQSLYEDGYFIAITYSIYKKLLDIPKVSDVFKSEKHRRFLMHLIAQHGLITDSDSMRVRYGFSINNENNIMCSHTGLITGYFGHSCSPNVFWGECDGHNVFITLRPVKKGESLHTTLFDILMESKLKRQQKLWEEKKFVCKCSRCEGQTISKAQRTRLLSSPDFQYIAMNGADGDSKIGMEKCKAFLRMCDRLPWCDEIGLVVTTYIRLLRSQLMGNININTVTERVVKDLFKN